MISNTFNSSNPTSDKHLISSDSIIPKSKNYVTRIEEIITNSRDASDCYTNSPWKNHGKSIRNSMENMHTDCGV